MPTENSLSPVILVVDDDPDLLEILNVKLQAEGFTPVLSLNGEHVREIITQQRPDLVLLDLHMKGVHGGDICKEIKVNAETASIPVVIFSSNNNIREIAESCGADAFIPKPFDYHTFKDIVGRFIPVT